MLRIKPGVDLRGLQPEMVPALLVAAQVLGPFAPDGCTVTSCADGTHREGSRHYVGMAVDLRTRHLPAGAKDAAVIEMKHRLGDQFDVVLEPTHLHVEFDPR